MHPLARMIDANANRAREGLRVMEDAARFGLDSETLCGQIKAMRHDLRDAIDQLGFDDVQLIASRDTPGDVGTGISTQRELARDSLASLAAAACKRVTEALRVMEEGAKADHVGRAAPMLEALRYRAYTVEKSLMLALAGGRAPQWTLCVLITESLCKGPWTKVAEAAMEGGADCVQLREKTLPDAALLERARVLVGLGKKHGASVIVNDRPDIALATGAAGVHLGQGDLPVSAVRELAGRSLLVGVSTHNLAEAQEAIEAGADYCGVGAMFNTSTKPRETSGSGYLRQYLENSVWARTPHLAIGGITLANVQELANLGCRGIAVSSAVCGADDPAGVCREFVTVIRRGAM